MATANQGVDEADTDSTEQAVAAAVAAAILSTDPGSESQAEPVAGWLGVIESAVGAVLLAFAMRVATALLRSTTASEPVWIDQARRRAKEAADDRVRLLAAQVEDVTRDLKGLRVVTPTDDRPPGDNEVTTGELTRRVKVDADLLGTDATVGVRELTRLLLAEDLGATYKGWRTRRDNRVRATHGGLEGNFIPLGQPFVTITGAMLMHPHDPTAPIGETARCRCKLAYRIPRKIGEPPA